MTQCGTDCGLFKLRLENVNLFSSVQFDLVFAKRSRKKSEYVHWTLVNCAGNNKLYYDLASNTFNRISSARTLYMKISGIIAVPLLYRCSFIYSWDFAPLLSWIFSFYSRSIQCHMIWLLRCALEIEIEFFFSCRCSIPSKFISNNFHCCFEFTNVNHDECERSYFQLYFYINLNLKFCRKSVVAIHRCYTNKTKKDSRKKYPKKWRNLTNWLAE